MATGVRRIRGLSVAGIVLGGLRLGAIAAAVVPAATAYSQSGPQVVVQGNRRVEAETIRSYFKTGQGERLDATKIDAALKALYATGLFQDVRINPQGGNLIVIVVENQVISRVAFEGNKKAKDEQLNLEIQSKARGTFSRATVQADVARIIEVYQRSGRYDVRVEPKIIELPNDRVDLVFEIKEGVKTGVAKIVFAGNRAYSDYRLKDVIKTGQTNWLSWLKSNDVYDADRIEVDRDLLRRFYLRHGFADVRVVSATAVYDPADKGFDITFTIEEGDQYKFGTVDIQSSVRAIPGPSLLDRMRTRSGNVYNADLVDKTVDDLTIEVAKRGFPFAAVRPRGDRDAANKQVNVVYLLEEGPHIYIERINIRGNTRTRDYVIRREFDIAEGDAYNRGLIDRAERRIKNLNYFKTVKITNEPGSAPDRLVVNVDVEEQSTGEFSIAAGYSTSDGVLGEISVGERNLLGTGLVARTSVSYGTSSRGVSVSFVNPYLLDERLALGLDLFYKKTSATSYTSYTTDTLGGAIKLGIPITDNVSTQLRYSAYRQEIGLTSAYQNCDNKNFNSSNGLYPTSTTYPNGTEVIDPATRSQFTSNCYSDGEASLAVKKELARGAVLVSLVGYSLAYNTLDTNLDPTRGLSITFAQDVAGAGGDVNYVKNTFDGRLYNEIMPDVVGLLRLQAGLASGWGGKDLRMLDHFQAGPSLVRGFQTNGFGPRDLTSGSNNDALGGTKYWATSLEVQAPIYFAPKDFGVKLAFFTDAGMLWDYKGPTSWEETGLYMTTCPNTNANGMAPGVICDDKAIRASAGMGIIWNSPFGPLRFDLAYPFMKQSYDHTQIFRFGGGTKF
jgi:outer membrane protein insertion porin family